MIRYLALRVLLLVPTLFAVLAINFAVVQLAPGGPLETIIAQLRQNSPNHPASPELAPATRAKLAAEFGFDQPPLARFATMLRGDLTFNLGTSVFLGEPVATLIGQRLPVSVALGLWSTLLVYLIAIPLGIAKAVRAGAPFDTITTLILLALFAIPGFLLAILLITLFAAGGVLPLLPLSGLATQGAAAWPWPARLADAAAHLVLPSIAMTAGGLASLTLLTRNAFLEELGKLYVTAARARGLGPARILYRHIFRNALLPLAAGFPAAFISIFFTSALLVEIIFSINGLGLLGYNAILQRDDPVMFGTLYVYTLAGLAAQLVGDVLYTLIDPRLDFSKN